MGNDAEPILDSSERDAILRQVFQPKPKTSSVSESKGGAEGVKTFGSLLEESLAIRESIEKEENEDVDKIREQVVGNSRLDLVEGVMRMIKR
jgi:hypothetical protein